MRRDGGGVWAGCDSAVSGLGGGSGKRTAVRGGWVESHCLFNISPFKAPHPSPWPRRTFVNQHSRQLVERMRMRRIVELYDLLDWQVNRERERARAP